MEEIEAAQGRELPKGHNVKPQRLFTSVDEFFQHPAVRRIGLGLSYIPTNVRCTSRTRLTAMLVRGTDRYGHFDDEPRPRVDVGAAERTVHADAVARFRDSNAEQTNRDASAVR